MSWAAADRLAAEPWHAGLTAACVKTTGRDEQDLLIEADPDLYRWLPYLGPAGWIGISLDGPQIDWAHLDARLLSSWRLAAGGAEETGGALSGMTPAGGPP